MGVGHCLDRDLMSKKEFALTHTQRVCLRCAEVCGWLLAECRWVCDFTGIPVKGFN